MPIISTIERKTIKGKLGLSIIYMLLIIGAITTIYPFFLMLRRTTTDDIDKDSLMPLPEFWWVKEQMAKKYLLQQYAIENKILPWIYDSFTNEAPDGSQFMKWEYLSQANDKPIDPQFKTYFWHDNFSKFEKIPIEKIKNRVNDYEEFIENTNLWFVYPLFSYRPGRSFNNQWIQFYLAKKENVSPKKYKYFESIKAQWTRRDWFPEFDENLNKWQDWLKNGLKPQEKAVYSSHYLWGYYLMRKYRNNIVKLRESHSQNYRSFANGPSFSTTMPQNKNVAEDWNDFIINYYPLLWQKIKSEYLEKLQPVWKNWLAEKKKISSLAEWNLYTQQNITHESQMDLTDSMPQNDTIARWWCDFVHTHLPVEGREILSPDADFANFLKTKYEKIENLNAKWGTNFINFETVKLPRAEADFYTITKYRRNIIIELTLINFKRALKLLALEGNATLNTIIIVILCLITGLTVNPLAAYALSRFKLKSTHKILLFLLATMALPAEIAMVPSFLLVKNLGLINTYFALILPHAANAFSIFLLKGFFDSLPAELYEAAMLDGAREADIFFRITIPLSMPIISVMILNITMGAYNMFMPVVIYISKQDMWPISTKIYEINQVIGGATGMAALVLASIFPLIVFIFCQRMIMRGIILPTLK